MANCGCPPGSILVILPDGTTVCRQDTVYLAEGPQLPIGCQKIAQGINAVPQGPSVFGRSSDYCKLGADFYPETAGKPFPISFNSLCSAGTQTWTDFSSTLIPPIASTSNALWGTGSFGFDGRFNLVGVNMSSTNPCGGGAITFGKYGFTFCLNVTTTTTYCFGFGGMGIEILINGGQFIVTQREDNYQYEKWTVVQLTLPAGSYIIQMTAYSDYGGTNTCGQASFPTTFPYTPVGFAFEIYKATASALSAMTTISQLASVLIYSTLNEFGQKMDFGDQVYNYRCPCGPPPVVCPTPFGQFNVVKPILDNCTVNSLNPNADPNIYVCHTYAYTPNTPCCYLLTECQSGATIVTNVNLAGLVGQVINISEQVGCWTVTQAPDCTGAIAVTPTAIYVDCVTCVPKCFLLTDCTGLQVSIITNTDLSAYVGQVIQLVGCGIRTCWMVNTASTCVGAITVAVDVSFKTCAECLPANPLPSIELLNNRMVKPGYNVSGACSTEYVDEVSCQFAEQIFNVVKKKRYGISTCCDEDLQKYQIKKDLLDLDMINDPNACKKAPCCPPKCLVVELKVYNPFSCPPPTEVEAVLLSPISCPAPGSIGPVSIVFNNPSS